MRRIVVITLLNLVAATVLAGDIVPLGPGLRWVYEDPAGNTQTVTNLGWTDFAGATCMRMQVVMTGPHSQTFDVYRSRGPEGEIYFHGAVSANGPLVYDPPVLEYASPLVVGESWSTETTVGGQSLVLAYRVQSFGPVFVPLGRFEAYRIAYLVGDEWRAGQFVVPGLGVVEQGIWELVAFGPVSPVASRSWSAVKSLFR